LDFLLEAMLQIAVMAAAAKLMGELSVRLGQPSVLGKLLAGVLVGPAVLGFVESSHWIEVFAEIGVLLLMFLAGMDTDLKMLNENRTSSLAVAVGGILFPLAGGYAAGLWLGLDQGHAVFLGLLLSATSVSISVQTFRELGKLGSREATTVLGAAIADDILVVIGLAVVLGLLTAGGVSLGSVFGMMAAFAVLAVLMVWKGIPFLLRLSSKLSVTEPVLSAAVIIVLLMAFAAEYSGMAGIIGSFAAGLAVSRTEFKEKVERGVERLAYPVFVPIFFVSIGLHVSFDGLSDQWLALVVLCVLAVLTKLIGAGLGARITGFGGRSSLIIGSGMVSRGEVALIIAALGLGNGLVPLDMYTTVILVIVFTTLAAPPMLKWTLREPKPAVMRREEG
jgi:Kef-type K+ transport systems, membrane components